MRFYNARDLEMVRTSTSVRRTSTITKSTAGAFVVTNSCSPSGDMLGGCEYGCGNDRAQAGVGFGTLSIRFNDKKGVLTRQIPHIPHIPRIRHVLTFIKFVTFLA